jgi:hypothetical protein
MGHRWSTAARVVAYAATAVSLGPGVAGGPVLDALTRAISH